MLMPSLPHLPAALDACCKVGHHAAFHVCPVIAPEQNGIKSSEQLQPSHSACYAVKLLHKPVNAVKSAA